jgi:hypothetical protein
LGPSSTITSQSIEGIPYPMPPMPLAKPPADLLKIPYLYARIADISVPIFSSPQDGDAGNPRRYIEAGFKYISYIARTDTSKRIYYQMVTGEWVDAEYAARAAPPNFQGFLVRSTPVVAFGWIINPTPSQAAPGFGQPLNAKKYVRLQVVPVYQSVTIDKTEWVMIARGEWVEKRFIARVLPMRTPPAGVGNGRWIEVNLYEQVLAVYDHNQLIFATLISTGIDPFFTRPGLFQIYKKKPTENMTGAFSADRSDYYYLENVPYTMYFDQARALHGAYWHSLFGYPRSHGCVNISIADSHWLYDWAFEGEWVYVWDPSGLTPTDPSLYSEGGA